MTGKEIFKIWAPAETRWTDWVRPVPFVAMGNSLEISRSFHFEIPSVDYISELLPDTAVFIDLPGYDSINEGLALAKLGFRPIPLYNGTNEPEGTLAIIDNRSIESALVWGALELEKLELPPDAPPAFLLDSNRLHRFKMNVSIFDNSWDLYDQDIPSAEYFKNNGIKRIIVRSERLQKDLRKIFYKFQKKGVRFLLANGFEAPKEVVIKKPSRRLMNRD